MAERCAGCGALIAMVGHVHNCVARTAVTNAPKPVTNSVTNSHVGVTNTASPVTNRGPYRYRDPDKWRAYMREYMARRRQEKPAARPA